MSLKKLFEEDREFNQGAVLTVSPFSGVFHSAAVKLGARPEYRLSEGTPWLESKHASC